MAIRVPSAQAVAEKWARVTPGRQQDYVAGVQAAGNAWQEGVSNAEGNYAQGVQNAIGEGRYASGVSGKASKYTRKSVEVGANRWGPGVTAARTDMEQGMARILSVLASVSLPPRGPKGSPQNLQRVAAVNEALHAAR